MCETKGCDTKHVHRGRFIVKKVCDIFNYIFSLLFYVSYFCKIPREFYVSSSLSVFCSYMCTCLYVYLFCPEDLQSAWSLKASSKLYFKWKESTGCEVI